MKKSIAAAASVRSLMLHSRNGNDDAVEDGQLPGLGSAADYKGVKSGFLEKQGKVVKSWKRHYVVLMGDGSDNSKTPELLYFKSPSDDEPLGRISIADKEISSLTTKEGGRGYEFRIEPKKPGERVFCFNASSDLDRINWMKALLTAKVICSSSGSTQQPTTTTTTTTTTAAAAAAASNIPDAESMASRLQAAIAVASFDSGTVDDKQLKTLNLETLYAMLNEVNEKEMKEYTEVVRRSKECKEMLVDLIHEKLSVMLKRTSISNA